MSATICADHMARRQVLHFKPAAGAFDNFFLLLQAVAAAE
jgi:hypothetical protein